MKLRPNMTLQEDYERLSRRDFSYQLAVEFSEHRRKMNNENTVDPEGCRRNRPDFAATPSGVGGLNSIYNPGCASRSGANR